MQEVEEGFKQRVCALVAQIPKGRVMTYGQLAALTGNARAARIVGGIAHFGDPDLPWQRVVNKQGGLASGYPGGKAGHKAHLESEGVDVSDDYKADVAELLWFPPSKPPLLVIVGPTASGKSALAMELAERLDGEIICADSRTVYKGMNIGTAKPSAEDQQRVRHHLLDIVDPDQNFTVADFKKLAESAIEDIASRGKLAIMVGGSGLYTDSVLFDYGFTVPGATRDPINPRHVNKIEQPTRQELRNNTLIIGLEVDRDILKERIENRIDTMIDAGFIDEIKRIQSNHPDSKALLAPGYKAFAEFISGHLSIEEAKTLFAKNDYKLAKRQMTWFKRNKSIHWLSNSSTYVNETVELLNKLQ